MAHLERAGGGIAGRDPASGANVVPLGDARKQGKPRNHRGGMQDLLELALDDPERAEQAARDLLESSDDPSALSYAHQCLGIVWRDSGKIPDAVRELGLGLNAARTAGLLDRERDVRATLGTTLVVAGRSRKGLAQLDRALDGAYGELGAKIRMRKAGVLALLGRYSEAAPVMRESLVEITRASNPAWEARTRVWLGHLELRLGRVDDAEREVVAAERLLRKTRSHLDRLTALENLAEIAVVRGDLAGGARSLCRGHPRLRAGRAATEIGGRRSLRPRLSRGRPHRRGSPLACHASRDRRSRAP